MKPTKISELLENINRLSNKGDFDTLSKLEIDLLMQQLRDLYAELDILRSNAGTQQAVVTAQPENKVTKRVLNPNQNILLEEPAQKQLVPEVKPVPEIINAAPQLEKVVIAEVVDNAKQKDEPADTPLPEQEKPTIKGSINESVQTVASINEKLKTPQQEVHRKLSTKPLKDLIDLNKRFILQNELFKGNSEALSTAINHIDQLKSFEEAAAYVTAELSAKNQWNISSQPAKLFAQLVKQKFGVE